MYRVVIEKTGYMMAASGVGRSLQGAALTALRGLLYANEEMSVLEQRGALWLALRAERLGPIALGSVHGAMQHKASGMRLEAHRLAAHDGVARFNKQEKTWQAMEG